MSLFNFNRAARECPPSVTPREDKLKNPLSRNQCKDDQVCLLRDHGSYSGPLFLDEHPPGSEITGRFPTFSFM